MLRALAYITLVFCTLLYVGSCDNKINSKIFLYKSTSNSVFNTDKWRYGDLYGMSYLSYFRKHQRIDSSVRLVNYNDPGKIDLYMACDSYIWGFFNTGHFYCGTDKFIMVKTNDQEEINSIIDSSKINVLMIEVSERNAIGLLTDPAYVKNIVSSKAGGKAVSNNYAAAANVNSYSFHQTLKVDSSPKKVSFLASLNKKRSQLFDYIFNRKINEHLEGAIWDNSLFTPIKEFKADINYNLFKRIDNNVKLSGNKKQLYYSQTIDTTESSSSFKHISDQTIDTLIANLNIIYNNGKKMGFNKIYLAIIPNPVSILEPNYNGYKYNHLIERIQQSPKLKMACINLLPAFTKLGSKAYSIADTHWSWNGAHLWLNEFNAELDKIVRTSK